MPGFFDIIFGQPEPEPEAPKSKKTKKAKKAKKARKTPMKKEDTVIDSLRAEIAEVRGMVTMPEPEPEPETEPEVEDEEPEPDDDVE